MFRQVIPDGHAPRAQNLEGLIEGNSEGDLRHPDGSPDIAAYARLAHRERAAAIAASTGAGFRRVREMLSGVRASLAPVARSGPPCGKRHAHIAR